VGGEGGVVLRTFHELGDQKRALFVIDASAVEDKQVWVSNRPHELDFSLKILHLIFVKLIEWSSQYFDCHRDVAPLTSMHLAVRPFANHRAEA
jgi:hypothetical protein